MQADRTPATAAVAAGPASDGKDRLYTPQFFQVFAAMLLLMTGQALQFHFGQYLGFLGHGVDTLGLVLSISMIGTLLIRFHLGRWIDRFGCRPTWLAGTVLVAGAVGSLQFAQALWLIALLRTAATMAFASVMTAVAVFAAQTAPPQRRAEAIGTMGLAGFTGMVLGPTLGDWIFSGAVDSIIPYRIFFAASASFSLAAGGIWWWVKLPAKHGPGPVSPAEQPVADGAQPSTVRVVLRHWPGAVLLIGTVFSMVFCLHMSFLERLAEARGFKDIKVFFLLYAPTAMTLRIILRRMPERFGRRRTMLTGMLLLAGGLLGLLGIRSPWGLVLPGLVMGAGHALIFPSMVDLAAGCLPSDYRGTGTALILGAGDLGMLIGFASLGQLIELFGFDAALIALASTVVLAAVVFAATWRRQSIG